MALSVAPTRTVLHCIGNKIVEFLFVVGTDLYGIEIEIQYVGVLQAHSDWSLVQLCITRRIPFNQYQQYQPRARVLPSPETCSDEKLHASVTIDPRYCGRLVENAKCG